MSILHKKIITITTFAGALHQHLTISIYYYFVRHEAYTKATLNLAWDHLRKRRKYPSLVAEMYLKIL